MRRPDRAEPLRSRILFRLHTVLTGGTLWEKVAGPRTLFAELLGADLEVDPGRARDSPDTAAATELSQGPLGVASAVGVRMTGYQLCAKRKPR